MVIAGVPLRFGLRGASRWVPVEGQVGRCRVPLGVLIHRGVFLVCCVSALIYCFSWSAACLPGLLIAFVAPGHAVPWPVCGVVGIYHVAGWVAVSSPHDGCGSRSLSLGWSVGFPGVRWFPRQGVPVVVPQAMLSRFPVTGCRVAPIFLASPVFGPIFTVRLGLALDSFPTCMLRR